MLLADAEQLGERAATTIRAHLAGCYPNVGRLPRTIGELLRHLSVTVAAPRPAPERLIAATWDPPARDTIATVLVVAAEDNTRSVLAARLGGAGFAVARAHDPVDALRWLYARSTPLAIVVDVDLGRKLASWLAHHPTYGRLVVLGVGTNEAVYGAAAPTGMAEVFAMPADEDALVAAIARRRVPRPNP